MSQYKSYQEAKEWIKPLGLTNEKDWKEYTNSKFFPADIPKNPYEVYSKTKEWISWKDFFGMKKEKYISYDKAKEWAITLNLSTSSEWIEYTKKNNFPKNIPKDTARIYRKMGQWENWKDFLGKKNKYISYEKAKEWAISLGLKSRSKYTIPSSGCSWI